jgi:pimeloyl-ACP methyl ester carboxylesterase
MTGQPNDVLDARVMDWLRTSEGASSRDVLDATFMDLASIRQDRWRPWGPLVDGLSRPWSLELPRWAWIGITLLLLVAISVASLTVASRLRPFIDRLSVLPAEPATLQDVGCPDAFAAAGDVRCRLASVPERHERPTGSTVRLLVAEFIPSDGPAGAAPVFVPLTLDPSGQRTVVDIAATAGSIGRSVIGVVPRGRVPSAPSLACTELESFEQPASGASVLDPAWRAPLRDAVLACRERLATGGVDIEAYGLAEQAADVESIRRGLGVDRWLIRTVGNDSRLAVEVLRRYPDGIVAAVLVGPSFPGNDAGRDSAEALLASIEALAALCAGDAFCESRYPPPDEAWAAAMDRLDPGSATLAARALRSALATPELVAGLPSRLERLATGDLAWPEQALATRGWCLGYELSCTGESGWTGGSELATVCLGRAPSSSPAATGVGGAPAVVTDLVASDPWDVLCDAWAGEARDGSTMQPVTSDVPVIVLASGLDPYRSLPGITSGMGGLSQGVLVQLPWTREGTGVGCLDAREAGWLDDPAAALPASCTGVALPLFADAP